METKNSTKANDTFSDNENAANKTFKATSSNLFDAYKKQMDLAADLYSNMFNSVLTQNRNVWNPVKDYADLFFNNNELKYPRMPFGNFTSNGSSANAYSSIFDKMIRHVADQNQILTDTFAKQFDEWTSNWGRLSDKYRDTVQKRMDVTKEMLSILNESYNRQVEFATENNKKFLEEMSSQADKLFKANQQFWTNVNSENSRSTENQSNNNSNNNNDQRNTKKAVKVDAAF